MNLLYSIILALYLTAPALAQQAVASTVRGPLSYTLREYGAILTMALLGGFARWWRAVRRGETSAYNLTGLIGELMVSALAGLMAFFICEAIGVHPLITAAIAGLAGHAGTLGIVWLEQLGKRWVERRFGVSESVRAPLGKD